MKPLVAIFSRKTYSFCNDISTRTKPVNEGVIGRPFVNELISWKRFRLANESIAMMVDFALLFLVRTSREQHP